MKSFFERLKNIELVVLAPSASQVPPCLPNVCQDENLHQQIISDIQHFRDEVFNAAHGFIWPQDYLDFDYKAWHLILRDTQRNIRGTARLAIYAHDRDEIQLENLGVNRFVSRMPVEQRNRYTSAINRFIEECRNCHAQMHFSEAGGWAIEEKSRGTLVTPVLAASPWALVRPQGGSMCMASAVVQNNSSEVLTKIGAFRLTEGNQPLSPFYVDFHGCDMEIVGFNSNILSAKFEATVNHLQEYIVNSTIITR